MTLFFKCPKHDSSVKADRIVVEVTSLGMQLTLTCSICSRVFEDGILRIDPRDKDKIKQLAEVLG